MRAIVEWSLRFRLFVLIAAVAMIAIGVVRLRDAPVDVLPEFGAPHVQVQTEALGLSAGEVEQLITVPMEEILHNVAWLRSFRSESVNGLSSITLEFQPGTDLMRARALVQERLTLASTLPTKGVSKPPAMMQPLSSTSQVMHIGMTSSSVSPIDMSVLARWTVRPRLMGVHGVANVAVWGMRQRQLQVLVDPDRLAAQKVTMDQVIRTTGDALWVSPLTFLQAATPGVTGGWVDGPNQRMGIRHVQPITTPEDLAKVVVSGTNLRLGDVATVVEGHQPLIGDAMIDGGPGLLLVVEKFPWANTLEVTRGVDEALGQLRPGLPGIEVDATVFRPATFIGLAIANLTRALLIGGALVALVLALLLFQWRTAAIALATIPLSLLAAILVLEWRGATINTMVLAGLLIAVGVVVDDAITSVDAIVRRLRTHRLAHADAVGGDPGVRSTMSAILEASLEARGPLVFATLALLLVLLPVLYLDGITGAFFRPLALSYGLAVLASMAVALTVTPALALVMLRKTPMERPEQPITRRLRDGYEGMLGSAIRAPRAALAAVGATMVVGALVWPMLGQTLVPSFKERDLLVKWDGAPGTSLSGMTRITTQAASELGAIPGVRQFNATIGRAVLGNRIVGINSAEARVSVDPNADYDATVAAVQGTADGYPGVFREVLTYLDHEVRQARTGTSDALVVRVTGPDLRVLRQKADEIQKAIAQVPGVVDVRAEGTTEEPQVEVTVDLAAAQRHGLKPGDVRRAAAILVNGLEVGNLFEGQKVFDVAVMGVPETRHSLTSLENLLIDTPNGGHVRLKDVAQVRVVSTPNLIRHTGSSRRIDVGVNVRGRDLGAVSRDIEARVAAISFSREYYPEILGEYAERQAAEQRLLAVIVAAAIGILLLMQAAYRSWRLALLSFLTLPSALVGGVLAAYLGSGVLSLGSLVGFLTVLGIAARNGIMMINHYQHLERHGGETFGPGLVLRGARERLSPILMTALATGLALIPIVFLGNLPGLEVVRPAAVVIVGGLITSTLLNLFVLPSLYLRFARPVTAAEEEDYIATGPSAVPAPAATGGGS